MDRKVILTIAIVVVIAIIAIFAFMWLQEGSFQTQEHVTTDQQEIQSYEGTKVANQFFTLLSSPNYQYDEIRPLLSKIMRAYMQSCVDLCRLKKIDSIHDEIGFESFKEVKWAQTEEGYIYEGEKKVYVKDALGLVGEIVGDTGHSLPVKVFLIVEDGNWVIDTLLINTYSLENCSDTKLRAALDLADGFINLLVSDKLGEAFNQLPYNIEESLLWPCSSGTEPYDQQACIEWFDNRTYYENYTNLKWTGFEVFGVSKLDGSLTKKVRFEGTVIDESGNTIPLIIDIIVGHMTLGYTTVEDTNLQIDQFLLGENTAYAPSISQGIKKPISEIPENPLGLVEVVGNPDAIAKIGDVVAVTFKMKVEGNNSYVPGSNQGDEWYMVIQLGHETLLPGIGKAVVGMRVGETKNVTLSPEDAYGSADEHPLGGKSVRIENLTLVTITQAQ